MKIKVEKELEIKQGNVKMSEPNMVMESKEEVIDTIAKKDFDQLSLYQLPCMNGIYCPPSYSFRIKKGDPIQVIKTTNIGTLQTDIFYKLKKHNGQNYAKTIAETPKQPIKDNSNFKGWISSGNDLKFNSILKGVFSEYNLPKDVVEETTIVDKIKDVVSVGSNNNSKPKDNSNLIKIALLGVVGFIIYKLVKK